MTFLPGAQVAVILHSTISGPEIALHHTTGLSALDSRVLAVSLPPAVIEKYCCASVAASARAVAAEVTHTGTWVYAVDSSGRLGVRLFRALGLTRPCFDQTGRFMAGSLRDELKVLDAISGACLYTKPGVWSLTEEGPAPLLSWAGRHHSQLHLTAGARSTCCEFETADSVQFSVLQF